MNSINAELLAIKTALEIIHDDFTMAEAELPAALARALFGVLDCCAKASEELHGSIVALAADSIPANTWSETGQFSKPRQHLSMLRSVLDLSLDHVSL
jgi:hypothetical protein